jgi:hypothetical protein
VLNFAERTSAAAYRAALKTDSGPYGIGDTPPWRNVRAHPGVTREHEVSRYALEGTLEMQHFN